MPIPWWAQGIYLILYVSFQIFFTLSLILWDFPYFVPETKMRLLMNSLRITIFVVALREAAVLYGELMTQESTNL